MPFKSLMIRLQITNCDSPHQQFGELETLRIKKNRVDDSTYQWYAESVTQHWYSESAIPCLNDARSWQPLTHRRCAAEAIFCSQQRIAITLKVPKHEIFLTELIILSYPIWIGDLGSTVKNWFVWYSSFCFFTGYWVCGKNYSSPAEYVVKIIPRLLSMW